jgi:hypothetical protein
VLICLATATTGPCVHGASLDCAANTSVPPAVRADGLAELASDLGVSYTLGHPHRPFKPFGQQGVLPSSERPKYETRAAAPGLVDVPWVTAVRFFAVRFFIVSRD